MTTNTPFNPQPVAPAGTGPVAIGSAVPRVDGHAKVTGQARYAAEHPVEGMVHAVVVCSTVARGEVTGFDLDAARRVDGVLDILTHENRPRMRSLGLFYKDMTAPAGTPFRPLHDGKVRYSGQPVAVVLATTFEAARLAAVLVTPHYTVAPHETDLLQRLDRAHRPSSLKAGFVPPPKEKGDADKALAAAPVRIDAEFHSGVEHHNPMEMHATTVIVGDDGHLTIHDKTQSSQNSRWVVSRVFGLPKRQVTVKNAFVGGAFGLGLRPQYQLILAVLSALHLKRSVRLVLSRPQMFTFGHRPETWQRVRLGAQANGKLDAIVHEAVAETSRLEDYVEVVVNWSGQLYAADHVRYGYQVVDLDHHSPIDMRAPGAAHGVHAIEVAMDELSYAVGVDPLELRLLNYAEDDPNSGKPFSTKALKACYREGAARFGWSERPPQPRARREGHEWVGWGMATGVWDAMQMVAKARASLHRDGSLVVESAATDIGTGTYTVMAQIAAAAMRLPLERVTFRLGDSDLPFAPIEGGSSHVTTVGSAVEGACEKLQRALWKLARTTRGAGFAGKPFEQVEFFEGGIRLRDEPTVALPYAALVDGSGRDRVSVSHLMIPKVTEQRRYTRATHSAVFCEVRVDEALGAVRVTRVVSAIAAGRIVNPKTATSQVIGGVVWGIGQALHEETHCDHGLGRFMSHDLEKYHVAANADVPDVDVVFVEEDDRVVSRLGAKGVGEIGLVGVAAAIANAIHHATGKRLRLTPMTPDVVMAAAPAPRPAGPGVATVAGDAVQPRDVARPA